MKETESIGFSCPTLHQNSQISGLNFRKLLRAMSLDSFLGKGYRAHPQTLPPSAHFETCDIFLYFNDTVAYLIYSCSEVYGIDADMDAI